VYNRELTVDNFGIHSPNKIYNTIDGQEKLSKQYIKRANANYSFAKSKRTFGEGKQTLNSVILPGPGTYEKASLERANVGNIFGRTKRGGNMRQLCDIANQYKK